MNPAHLTAIRVAHRDRIDLAAIRAQRSPKPQGMSPKLFAVGCWLIAQGIADDEPCFGETWFKTPLSYVRRCLAGLDPASHAVEIEDGRRAIYEGRHPVYVPLVDMDERWAA